MKSKIDLTFEIDSLKTEFLVKNLDLDEIWDQPTDQLRATRELKYMLLCIELCKEDKSPEQLFIEGHLPPHIKDPTMPEEDWSKFIKWTQGKIVIEYLIDKVDLKNPDDIPEDEIESELKKLITQIENANIGIQLLSPVPPIILYKVLHEWILDENPEACETDGWIMNGCGAYCPGCYMRPWCDVGIDLCWSEDEEIKNMYLRPELRKTMSAWPGVYPEMRRRQDIEDAENAEMEKKWAAIEEKRNKRLNP